MMIQLQNSFLIILAHLLKSPWDVVQVHYENYQVAKNDRWEIFQAAYETSGHRSAMRLPQEALDVLEELQKQIPEDQDEPWTWLEFSLESGGKYQFEYRYGMPPLIAEQLKYL